ncbi:hypothetical protein [Actinoplanes sp. NPDC051411]|uniref:hypothetical protein n=1 Tax=Actinoplanes sp. NPDC051411 TaxID=3155522 RepID=UPI003446583A
MLDRPAEQLRAAQPAHVLDMPAEQLRAGSISARVLDRRGLSTGKCDEPVAGGESTAPLAGVFGRNASGGR